MCGFATSGFASSKLRGWLNHADIAKRWQTSMKTRILLLVFASCVVLSASPADKPAKLNALTPAERKAGWKLLFDGRTLNGWRGYRKPGLPQAGWVVEDGCLKLQANSGGGDIITVDQFTDFDLQWDWRIGPKGNNGVKYLVTEERPSAPGHEYQMLDDATTDDPNKFTASFYDVLPPQKKTPLQLPGQWNHSRILVQGKHVEHWLNGEKVLKYELESPEAKAAIAQSKFKNAPGFGDKIKGHILLTDHKEETWYRNIKIREPGVP
jgi:hypothetical protein